MSLLKQHEASPFGQKRLNDPKIKIATQKKQPLEWMMKDVRTHPS